MTRDLAISKIDQFFKDNNALCKGFKIDGQQVDLEWSTEPTAELSDEPIFKLTGYFKYNGEICRVDCSHLFKELGSATFLVEAQDTEAVIRSQLARTVERYKRMRGSVAALVERYRRDEESRERQGELVLLPNSHKMRNMS